MVKHHMQLVSFLLLVLSFNLTVSASGLQQPSSGQSQVEAVDQQPLSLPVDYVIGPGDVLSVRIFQQPELGGDVRVSAQGYIRLLFVEEPIKAEGLNEWELAQVIREKLTTILRDPQVSVRVMQAQRDMVYILGAVQRPGSVAWSPGTRLLNLVAAAGGLGDRAGYVAHILRGSVWSGNGQRENQSNEAELTLTSVLETVNIRQMLQGRVELNKPIYPGDIVSVPEADRVFVGGNVNTPGAFTLQGELTLSQALTLAGGLKPASKRKVTIIRQEAGKGGLTEITVDLGEVEKDQSKDVALQANDIVFVPDSKGKRAFYSGLEATVRTLTGVIIWR